MSKLKLNITEQAKADITLITEFISKDNQQAAKSMAMYLYNVCQDLARFPEIGTARPDFTYKNYKTYGWQVTTGTAEEKKQARFVSSFLDIYNNSFSQ